MSYHRLQSSVVGGVGWGGVGWRGVGSGGVEVGWSEVWLLGMGWGELPMLKTDGVKAVW